MEIKLNSEQLALIAMEELRALRKYFLELMDEEVPNVFSTNPVYDKLLIEKHMEAASLLLSWYEG
jgi:hypothetical protein